MQFIVLGLIILITILVLFLPRLIYLIFFHGKLTNNTKES